MTLIIRNWDGMSARTLDAVHHYGYSAHPSIPYDPADFRRCYNWFILVLGGDKERLKRHLAEVAKVHEMWKPFAENWDRMEDLYLEETKSETVFKKAPKLYEFMQKIRE